MRARHETTGGRSILEYRRADAIQPDPVRRTASFLVALGVVVSGLVLADAIRYWHMPPGRETTAPVLLGFADLDGNPEDKDRGEQKETPEDDKPKQEPKQEDEPADDPPAPVRAVNAKPPGPAASDDDNKRPGIIAVEGGGRPARSLYSNRGAQARQAALGKYGGNAKTERAVRLGLQWLAGHQDDDGKWSSAHFDNHCRPGGPKCGGAGESRTLLDPAMTGLALLAFGSSNCTHLKGTYKDHVAKGVRYLCGVQADNGCFGGTAPRGMNYYMMYNHGIATFALAELCAMTGDPAVRRHVERAVRFIVTAQQMSGAWNYNDAKTGRYDTSVTGWQVMALKSAQSAGVDIPHYTLYKLTRFLDRVTLATGELIYSNKFPARGRRGWGMVAVGLASSQFLGLPSDRRTAKRQTAVVLSHLPDWSKTTGATPFDSIYYWYYGTIAMFQVGGKAWDKWNAAMQKELLFHQRIGGCAGGSWDPPNNFWGRVGGRIYATALNIMNLQIYYRYLPLYSGAALNTVEALIATTKSKGRSHAIQALRLLAHFDDPKARELLIKLAHGDDHGLAMQASLALAEKKDAAAIAPLLKQFQSSNQFARYQALRAMQPMIDEGLVPIFIKALRDKQPTVSGQAARALRQHANVSFGFEPEAGLREREQAIRKWEAWWEDQQKGIVATKGSAPWLVVRVLPDKGLVAFHTGSERLTGTGTTYDVYRSDKYIGRVRLVKVGGEICIGKILEGDTPGDVKSGDVVRPGK